MMIEPPFEYPPNLEAERRLRCVPTEADANIRFLRGADAEVVRAFWASERPVDWPPVIPFPTDREAEILKYDQKLRKTSSRSRGN